MKLKPLLPEVISRFNTIPRGTLVRHIAKVKVSGNYEDLETRIAWDVLHATYRADEICDWYEEYNCNDSHITTLVREALNKAFPDILN